MIFGLFNISASDHSMMLEDVSVPAVNRFCNTRRAHAHGMKLKLLNFFVMNCSQRILELVIVVGAMLNTQLR